MRLLPGKCAFPDKNIAPACNCIYEFRIHCTKGEFAISNIKSIANEIVRNITREYRKERPDFKLKIRAISFYQKSNRYVMPVTFNINVEEDFVEVFLASMCKTLKLKFHSVKMTDDKTMIFKLKVGKKAE